MRILFVALSVALGWGLRGEIGGEQGALIPGVLLGTAIALCSGKESWVRHAPLIGAVSAFGMSLGGIQSYGLLIGYTMCTDMLNVTYGYLSLAIVGGLWGAFAGGLLGMVLSGKKRSPLFWGLLVILFYVGGEICYFLLIDTLGLLMTPPRAENWAWCLGVVITLIIVNVYLKDFRPVRTTLKGFLAGGIGFMFGESLQVYGKFLGPQFDWWKVMEISFGFVMGGGLAITIFSEFKEDENTLETSPMVNILAIMIITAFVPLVTLHNMLEGFEQNSILKRTDVLWQDGYFNIMLRGIALTFIVFAILKTLQKRGLFEKLNFQNLAIFLFIWSIWSNGWITQIKMALPHQGLTSVIIHYIFLVLMLLLSAWSVWGINKTPRTSERETLLVKSKLNSLPLLVLLILTIIPLLALFFAGTSILTHPDEMPVNIRRRFEINLLRTENQILADGTIKSLIPKGIF